MAVYSTAAEQYKCQLYPPFMETLIGSNEKQVIRYENGNPVFDREEDRDYTNVLKSGAKKFITDWAERKQNRRVSKDVVRRPFEKLFYNPKRKHIDLIGNLHYEDFKDTKIVSFDEKCPYWRKPGKLLSDLGDSGWKGAFLKKLGIWFPIVLGIYLVFGTIRVLLIDAKKVRHNEL